MAVLSTIGPTTAVRGNVRGDGDLEILGRVEGSVVVSGDVTVGDGALVRSDVRGRRVVVRGAVAGNVSGDEAVILEEGARVVGDLGAPQVGIRPGALLRGHVSTAGPLPEGGAQQATAAATPARATPAARPAAPAARAAAPAARPAPAPARPAPAPARPAPAPARATPAARPAPARPAQAAAPPPPPEEPRSAAEPEHEDEAASFTAEGGPPPPVVPAIRKGTKAAVRKRGAGR